jgi:hypothetical protein
MRQHLLERVLEEEAERAREIRPLEDPYLVGETAARQARAERLARENQEEILINEDRRWDWFIGKSDTPFLPPRRKSGKRKDLHYML